MIPAKVAMPPAVLRVMAPSPMPKRPTMTRYNAAPITARLTPGAPNAMLMFCG